MISNVRGHCRSCGADVFWLVNVKTGKKAPIDCERAADGNVLVDVPAGTYSILSGDLRSGYLAAGEQLRKNHFTTCPQARQWVGRTA